MRTNIGEFPAANVRNCQCQDQQRAAVHRGASALRGLRPLAAVEHLGAGRAEPSGGGLPTPLHLRLDEQWVLLSFSLQVVLKLFGVSLYVTLTIIMRPVLPTKYFQLK